MQRENERHVALRQSVDVILAKASREEWSVRQLAEKIGFSARTWSRILSGRADLKVWLPKLREAATHLNLNSD